MTDKNKKQTKIYDVLKLKPSIFMYIPKELIKNDRVATELHSVINEYEAIGKVKLMYRSDDATISFIVKTQITEDTFKNICGIITKYLNNDDISIYYKDKGDIVFKRSKKIPFVPTAEKISFIEDDE